MKIVIDIDEGIARGIIDGKNDTPMNIVRAFQATIADAIKNGTPLPKGHGRLKDIDEIITNGITKGWCEWYDEMKYAPTIIEADKGDTE